MIEKNNDNEQIMLNPQVLAENQDLENFTLDSLEYSGINKTEEGSVLSITEDLYQTVTIISCTFVKNQGSTGGCIYINPPNPVLIQIQSSTFESNTATDKGAAIAILFGAEVTFDHCIFNGNTAVNGAGVVYITPKSPDERNNCIFESCEFNTNSGKESKCILVDSSSDFVDHYTLELRSCNFANNYDNDYAGGACCVSNCEVTKVDYCIFSSNSTEESCGGINVTAKGNLFVSNCNFFHCNAGEIEGSYGGGIGYTSLNMPSSSTHMEEISIHYCIFENNAGQNGVALLLNVVSMNVDIHDVHVINHYRTNFIFCIYFNFEADENIFTLNNINFISNSHDSINNNECCGGTGIWISESLDYDYLESLSVEFQNCFFNYNYSPGNGGAIAYGTYERLKSVKLIFDHCQFNHNRCQNKLGGACHFLTKQSVELYNCEFKNNSCIEASVNGGGGAISLGTSVPSVTIDFCEFEDCAALSGSFIYTEGPINDFHIYKNTFKFTNDFESQNNCVYLNAASSGLFFCFEENDFIGLSCIGLYGGSGLHIVTGRDCEVTSCSFRLNNGEGQIIIPDSSNSKLIFKGCSFYQGYQNSRVVYIKNEASVDFDSCKFQNFDDLSSTTDENTIISKGKGLLVYSLSQSKESSFENCIFENVYCFSALDFENYKRIEFDKCVFTKVYCLLPETSNNQNSDQGGLFYLPTATQITFTFTNRNHI